jgi:hypothetical protein
MPPPSLKWPELATLVEISGTTHNYIMATNVNATALYHHIKANKSLRVPGLIIHFLQNATKAMDYALQHPLGAD